MCCIPSLLGWDNGQRWQIVHMKERKYSQPEIFQKHWIDVRGERVEAKNDKIFHLYLHKPSGDLYSVWGAGEDSVIWSKSIGLAIIAPACTTFVFAHDLANIVVAIMSIAIGVIATYGLNYEWNIRENFDTLCHSLYHAVITPFCGLAWEGIALFGIVAPLAGLWLEEIRLIHLLFREVWFADRQRYTYQRAPENIRFSDNWDERPGSFLPGVCMLPWGNINQKLFEDGPDRYVEARPAENLY